MSIFWKLNKGGVAMNFLDETLEAIKHSGHTISDVMFIGSYDGKYRMKWDKFKEKADFEYDSGFGSQHIAEDLIVFFYDQTYLTRDEYDGSEWWEYNEILAYKDTDDYKDFDILGGEQYDWELLFRMNKQTKKKKGG